MTTADDCIRLGVGGAVSAFLRAVQQEDPRFEPYEIRVTTRCLWADQTTETVVELKEGGETVAAAKITAGLKSNWVEFSLAMAATVDALSENL